jgi:hypothetical protein
MRPRNQTPRSDGQLVAMVLIGEAERPSTVRKPLRNGFVDVLLYKKGVMTYAQVAERCGWGTSKRACSRVKAARPYAKNWAWEHGEWYLPDGSRLGGLRVTRDPDGINRDGDRVQKMKNTYARKETDHRKAADHLQPQRESQTERADLEELLAGPGLLAPLSQGESGA